MVMSPPRRSSVSTPARASTKGRACARSLAANGVRLTVAARTPGPLEETAQAIRDDFGVEVTAVAADITSPEGRRRTLAACPAPELDWRALPDPVRHVFTHFELDLVVVTARMAETGVPDGEGRWCPAEDVSGAGLPSLFRKVVGIALEAAGEGGTRRRRGARLSRR